MKKKIQNQGKPETFLYHTNFKQNSDVGQAMNILRPHRKEQAKNGKIGKDIHPLSLVRILQMFLWRWASFAGTI